MPDCDGLEIGGVVAAGEGVSLPPSAEMTRENSPAPNRSGTLEHHVFECMRDPGDTLGFVTRTDLVPDPVTPHGCTVIFP